MRWGNNNYYGLVRAKYGFCTGCENIMFVKYPVRGILYKSSTGMAQRWNPPVISSKCHFSHVKIMFSTTMYIVIRQAKTFYELCALLIIFVQYASLVEEWHRDLRHLTDAHSTCRFINKSPSECQEQRVPEEPDVFDQTQCISDCENPMFGCSPHWERNGFIVMVLVLNMYI